MALPNFDPMFTAFITGIIGSIFAGVASLITAIRAGRNGKKADVTNEKINVIHKLTNGSNEKLKEELAREKRRNEYLTRMVSELADFHEPGTLQAIRDKLDKIDAELGMRRHGDLGLDFIGE